MNKFKGLVVDYGFVVSDMLGSGDFFNILGCVGGVGFTEILAGF